MTQRVGVRELTRNFNILQDYDYVEIEDKKSKKTKGLFVSAKYTKEVKEFLDAKLKAQKQKKIDELLELIGKGDIEDRFNNLNYKEIKKMMVKEKYEN